MRPGEDLLNDPVEWGRKLIRTEDHDPLYTGLWRWKLKHVDDNRVRRYLIAYWSCYSVGASWWISQHEGLDFWRWLHCAAQNEIGPEKVGACELDRWPRAHERRHWRGQKCVDSVLWLSKEFPNPEDAVKELENLPGQVNLRAVELAVTRWPQFGPWIAFKAADMLERVMGLPVSFPNDITTLYRDPRKGAELAGPLLGHLTPQGVTERLLEEYRHMVAPPGGDRYVNVQEVETVLCKWKSARGGHYWIGADTKAHREELQRWGAQDLLSCYPTLTA